MSEVLRDLPAFAAAHLRLSLVALVLAAAASLPLGIAAARRPRLARVVLGTVGVVQTIPSLALLAVMVPALAAIGAVLGPSIGVVPPAIGAFPATLALTLYGMLPILANTVAGIRGVDPAVLEAADGVGMTRGERLRRVELPLAAPVIVAGLRTATVWVVGTATLATPIGATSLGNLIFGGLQTRNVEAIAAGCVAAAALALLLDAAIAAAERSLRARRGSAGALAGALAAAAAVFALAAWSLVSSARPEAERRVRIGAKPFTEQAILAEVLGGQIARATGLRARTLPSLGSTVLFDGLAAGEIDVAVDYAGTLWTTILGRQGAPPGPARMLEELRADLAERHGVRLLVPLGFENAYALAMGGDAARHRGLESLSDLAEQASALSIGADYEFFSRPEWAALVRTYGFAFRERRTMDPSLLYEAVDVGAVDVIAAYSSDGRIASSQLEVLEDDRGVIPPYDALVLVSRRFDREHPEAVAALRALENRIDAPTMRRLNAAVDRDGKAPAAVATGWLESARE